MAKLKLSKAFGKKKKVEEEIEEYVGDKVKSLAIYGSGGSGKSTLAIRLATELAKRKKNVCIIFCDMITPMLPCVALEREFQRKNSLGSILSANTITQKLVETNISLLKDNEYIGMLGYIEGENEYSYTEANANKLLDLFNVISGLFDYVIVDNATNITNNLMSYELTKLCDACMKVATQDAKSISYFISQEKLLKDNDFIGEKLPIKIVVYKNNVIEELFGNCDFKFPYIKEVEGLLEERTMTKSISKSKDSIKYNKEIDKVIKGVFGE